MKRSAKTGLKVFGIIVLVCSLGAFCIYILPVSITFHGFRQQMLVGQKYMDSLTEKDFQVWADRTQRYLSEFDPKADMIGSKPVPPELEQLKIIRIDEDSNWVSYVWMGGMDHTELLVEKLENGSFQFTARYDDESNRVIWPKMASVNLSQTNLTLQLRQ
jgi:hypothetical protein